MQLKEFQHNIPSKSHWFIKRGSCSPVDILQQVLWPKQTDVDVQVFRTGIYFITDVCSSDLIDASTADDTTNTWSTQVKKMNSEHDAGFGLSLYGI